MWGDVDSLTTWKQHRRNKRWVIFLNWWIAMLSINLNWWTTTIMRNNCSLEKRANSLTCLKQHVINYLVLGCGNFWLFYLCKGIWNIGMTILKFVSNTSFTIHIPGTKPAELLMCTLCHMHVERNADFYMKKRSF